MTKFAEAILVDQERVDQLPSEEFHPYYNDGMWRRNRDDHVRALLDLMPTVDQMPKRLLKELTEFSLNYKSEVVQQPFLDFISDLATQVASPWLYETATLFFSELMREVKRKSSIVSLSGEPVEIISKWFEYDDPIRIAEDSENEYVELLAAHVQQETERDRRALIMRSKRKFKKLLEVWSTVARLEATGKLKL